ncbi:MAG: hypothetical protein MHPSP_000349, partial [Paramarteilia canceri]
MKFFRLFLCGSSCNNVEKPLSLTECHYKSQIIIKEAVKDISILMRDMLNQVGVSSNNNEIINYDLDSEFDFQLR